MTNPSPPDTQPVRYPSQYESTAVLRDGGSVLLRPIRPDDASELQAFHGRLSRESVYYRFFSPMPHLEGKQLRRFVDIDYVTEMALVAILDDRIIGVGRYSRIDETDHAEVAFTVEDAHQGRGIGSLLLERLTEIARERGIRTFEAEVLGDNRKMLQVFASSGFEATRTLDSGTVHLVFRIDPTAEAVARAEERERVAVMSSLEPVFSPHSIAVVGASRHPGTIGHEIFRNLLRHGFTGPVYPVNPHTPVVASVSAYPTVSAVPGPVDLAIVVVPADQVHTVVEDCARHGVKAIVVISSGFAETGPAGHAAQDDLRRFVRSHGMRMIGPNCMGVLNTHPEVRMDATFAPVWPPAGNVSMSSQSGALGLAILDYACSLGLGISTFVSVGNKADISSNDLLQWWEDDPSTSLVLLYLESFGNPRKFARLARRIGARKPIVAVKAGRSDAGRRAATTHTAALTSSDQAVTALFAQCGVIRTYTLEELFDVATLLAHQPVPPGNRVAILTNAGGPGVLCADACEASGLMVASLSEETTAALTRLLPADAAIANPVDMIASATAEQYRRCLDLLLADPTVDAVIVIFIPPLVTHPEEVAEAIVTAAASAGPKPVLSCFIQSRGVPDVLRTGARPIPSYVFPESAATALSRAYAYGAWRRQPAGIMPDLQDVDRDGARLLVNRAPDGWLPAADAARLLSFYRIPVAPSVPATTAEEAIAAAEGLGWPVAMKVDLPALAHKTEVGGVALDVAEASQLRAALSRMHETLNAERVVVQPMVASGHEALLGVSTDPTFGPIVAFGLGGIFVELLGDVVFRITPLTDRDAREMVQAIRSFRLLEGYRGGPPGDQAAVEDALLRVSAMVEDIPELVEMDLNPLRVLPPGQGVVVLDAKIRVEHAAQV